VGVEKVRLRDGRWVELRSAQVSDASGFLGFIRGLSSRSRDFMHGWSTVAEDCHAQALATKTENEGHCALIAIAPGPHAERVVGYCWVDGLGGPDIPMLGIGIVDEYHEVGLGKTLLAAMIAHLGSLGVPRVKLGVWADNARALHVYERVGFHLDPALPAQAFDGRTEIYMVAETGVR
jgi:ribosomal protein S18 acetylase RimI-like enzyme